MHVHEEHEVPIYINFFNEHTSNQSGDRLKPKKLLIHKHALNIQLYALYPRLLRDRIRDTPSIYSWAMGGPLNKFKKSILAVVAQGELTGFCPERERREREEAATLKYYFHLECKRQTWIRNHRGSEKTPGKSNPTEGDSDFDSQTYNPQPRSFPILLSILHTRRIKFTMKVFPHRCPFHESGPIKIKILEMEHEKMAKLKLDIRKLWRSISLMQYEIDQIINNDRTPIADALLELDELKQKCDELKQECSDMETVPTYDNPNNPNSPNLIPLIPLITLTLTLLITQINRKKSQCKP